MSFDGFSTLPPHVNERFKRFMSGDLPPAHINMGIRPDLWCKEAEIGRVLFRWPNDGSRDTLVINGQCPNKHRMAN